MPTENLVGTLPWVLDGRKKAIGEMDQFDEEGYVWPNDRARYKMWELYSKEIES